MVVLEIHPETRGICWVLLATRYCEIAPAMTGGLTTRAPEHSQVYMRKYLGVSMVMGVPPNGWIVMENPNQKWIIWGFSPFRKHTYIATENLEFIVAISISNQ